MTAALPRSSGPMMEVAPYPSEPPAGFVDHTYTHTWTIDRPRAAVWEWLCDPSTFVDGQIPPYRVEFLTNATGQTGFTEGVYNAHTGPFMSFSGILGEIDPECYRDLQYFYGSYALSHRLFRPTRLQFWLEDGTAEGTSVLHLQVDAFVRRSAQKVWVRSMGVFWKRFGSWCERDIPNNWLR